MERGTEYSGRVRGTGHPFRLGDKERGALPLRSKTFGTDGSRTTAVQSGQISGDDNEGGATLVIAALRRAFGARPIPEAVRLSTASGTA